VTSTLCVDYPVLSPVVCYEVSACRVSDPSSLTVAQSVAAVQHAYVARRTRLSDAVIPNKQTTQMLSLSGRVTAHVDKVI